MALGLYRRHRRECKAGHSEDQFSTEFEERKHGWKRCDCPIVVSGTLSKKFRRHTTRKWEWDDARAIAANFETAASWDAEVIIKVEPPEKTEQGRCPTAEATKIFLAELKET